MIRDLPCAAMPGSRHCSLVATSNQRGDRYQDAMARLGAIKRVEVTSALSSSHGLSVADLVLACAWLDPATTSGRSAGACVEQYRPVINSPA